MSIVTLFGYPKRVVSVLPLITFISQIKRGKYEDMIERFRDMHLRELDTLIDSQRRMIPKFSIAGNFKVENRQLEIINYSGYLFFEIKYLHPREYENAKSFLMRCPYVFACFKNSMGNGICFILKSEEGIESHSKVFRRAYRYFEKKSDFFEIEEECWEEKFEFFSRNSENIKNLDFKYLFLSL